jgi:hypothetical protein
MDRSLSVLLVDMLAVGVGDSLGKVWHKRMKKVKAVANIDIDPE